MVGPVNHTSNAVIGGTNVLGQYDIIDSSFAGIVSHNTSGTSVTSFVQQGGVTTMTWTRGVSNGDVNDAQVSTYALTQVIWAVGSGSVFSDGSPNMGSTAVNLLGVKVYSNSVTLTAGLTLQWNLVGQRLDMQAVYVGKAWYVSVVVCLCVYQTV